MGLTVPALAAAVARAHAAMATLADPLNAADARLGDGDTGTMLSRLIGVFAAVDLGAAPDLGAAFMALARAGAASTGSSLGTLVVTAMLTAGRATAGAAELDWARLGPLFASIRDAAMARGKAGLGAKTIIDGLEALATAIEGLDDPAAIATAADLAMTAVLAEFRARPSGMGRARMFGERSIGLDDPGMLALAELVRAVAGPGAPAHGASGLA